MEYKKTADGNHFYRIGDSILHVFHAKNDKTVVQESKSFRMVAEIKKDDCCINTVPEIMDSSINCSKEEFDNKLKDVIFILGIYEFCEPIKN